MDVATRLFGGKVDMITEPTFAEFIKNGAIDGIIVKETKGGFQVLVTLLWDTSKQLVLITQRTKEPKTWSSLNRLVQHLSRYPNLPTIKLEVRSSDAATAKQRKKPAAK